MMERSRKSDPTTTPLVPAPGSPASALGNGHRTPAGPLGTPMGTHGGASAAHWIAALHRSRRLITCVFIIVAGISIPCIWLLVQPTFRARAVIRVSPVVSRVVFKTEDNGIVPLYRSYLNTQISVISSPTILQRVLDRPDVRNTEWYREPPSTLLDLVRMPPDPMDRIRQGLMVKPRRDTELIDVAFVALNRNEAMVIVNALVDEYKSLSDQAAEDNDLHRTRTLLDQRNALQRQIDGLVDIKHKASKHLGTMTAEELRSMLNKNLTGLEVEYRALQRELSIAQWELKAVDDRTTGKLADTDAPSDAVEPQGSYSMDPEWRRLKLNLRTARHQLEQAAQHYGETHPRIQTLQSDAKFAEQLVRDRETQLDDGSHFATPKVPAGGGGEVMAFMDRGALDLHTLRLDYQCRLLKTDLERERERVANVGDVAQDMARYDEEIRQKRDLLEHVRTRITQLEMESKAPGRISVAARATSSSQPYKDRRIAMTVLALGGAFMFGLFLGYVRVLTDQRIREVGDVQQAGRIPFLGKLPHLAPATNLLTDNDPMVMENVRMVRTALLQRLTGTGKRVILITSSSSRAGKSSFAVLLCRSLAQLGKRTLLVEADLHRPSLAGYLGIGAKVGLARLLTDRLDDSDAIISPDTCRFDVLPAGERIEDFNYELLANGVFSACLERWKERYDYVVLDSPPFLPVADARILASQADGTIMVLRSAHCRRDEAVQAYAGLSAGGGTLLGTVLVGARLGSDHGYYGDYARTALAPQLRADGPVDAQA